MLRLFSRDTNFDLDLLRLLLRDLLMDFERDLDSDLTRDALMLRLRDRL